MDIKWLIQLAEEWKITRLYKWMPFSFTKSKFLYGDWDRYLWVKEIEVTKYKYVAFVWENEWYKINKKDYNLLTKICSATNS